MEHFAQTNVLALIYPMFAWITTIFVHLIIGCAIRYPKIGNLRYDNTSTRATASNLVSKSQFEQNRDTNIRKAMATVDKGESIRTAAIKFTIPHSTLHDRVMQRQSKDGFKAWAS